MKKASIAILAVLLVSMMTSCVDIDNGYVGVRTWKRGDNAGEIEILPVGRHDRSIRADVVRFPTYKQNYVWTANPAEGSENDESITFPIEGLEITIDVGIEFSVIPQSVGVIWREYRLSLEGITDGPMRNYVRDSIMEAAKSYDNMEQFITNNEIANLIDAVELRSTEYFATKGIQVENIYLIGAPVYPGKVVSAIEEKIEATQRAIMRENELREAEADAAKKVAEAEGNAASLLASATAEAEANRLLERSLTDQILRDKWIAKWNGDLPDVVSGDEASLLLNIQ